MVGASSGEVGRHLRHLFDAGSGVGLTDAQLLERIASSRGHDGSGAEAAFETILARYGSTVWAVSRQVLGDHHAAEDAFQATFLVLARRAGSLRLRDGGSLGAWLHGVAHRTALKTRRGTTRRRLRERKAARPEVREGSILAAIERDDLGAALHAEVARLPSKYRAPVVLCYFEGRTHDEAAAALRCPIGTVRSRLSRARELLKGRLVRRRLASAMGLMEITSPARAEVPAALRRATLAAAIGAAPAPGAAAMAGLPMRSLLAARPRLAALALVAVSAGLALAFRAGARPDDLLAPAVEPRRSGEPLPDHARSRLGVAAFRHGDPAAQVLYGRDGETLITLGVRRTVSIWDAVTGRLRHEIPLSADLFHGPIAPDPSQRVALSPDGRTLATTEPTLEPRLRLWDVATGSEVRRWHLAGYLFCTSPAFTADGLALITVGSDRDPATGRDRGFFDRWDLTVPSERRRRDFGSWGHIGDGFQISPDGRTLATIGGRPDRKPPAAPQPPADPNNPFLPGPGMMIPRDDEVRIVDLEEERDRAVLRPDGAAFRAMAFSPDGRWLATSLVDGTVRVYDAANGRERLPRLALRGSGLAPEGSEWINSLAFSPDGSVLAGCWNRIPVAPSPGGLSLWDLDTGRQRWTAEFRAGPSSLAFSPDGQMISTAGSSEPMPRFWDVSTGREASPQPGHTLGITALAAAADGTIFTGSPDGTVRRWDPGTGRELEIVARPGPVSTLAVSADGKRLIVVGSYGTPVLWSVSDHRERNRLYEFPEQGTNQPVACSPDGRTVARGRRIWDAASGRLLKTLRTAGEREGFEPDGPIFYTPDGKRVVTAEPGVVRTWDIETGVEAAPPMRSGRILPASVAVSADARFLATGLPLLQAGRLQLPSEWWPDGWIRVWELATGREIAKLPVQQDSVSGVALSPDGRLLATFRTGGDPVGNPEQPPIQDPTIRVWDVMSGRERRRLVGHRGVVNTAVFTPDGRSLVSAGEDATAIVWDVSDLRASTIGPR